MFRIVLQYGTNSYFAFCCHQRIRVIAYDEVQQWELS